MVKCMFHFFKISYRALDLAKYILQKCIDDSCPISNLQLQKILYYVQGEFLREDRKAFAEPIEAWILGPVVPSVFERYCMNGAMQILDVPDWMKTEEDEVPEISEEVKKIVDKVVEAKRVLPPWDMVRATQKKDGPWDITYADGKGNHKEISLRLIKKSFKDGCERGFFNN